VQAFPHLRDLAERAGIMQSITTQISSSRVKSFPLVWGAQDQRGPMHADGPPTPVARQVTFVDTPGLVDGDMKYAFEIDKALELLGRCAARGHGLGQGHATEAPGPTVTGQSADLILVFFDPMGQALCKRTLDIVGTIGSTWRQRCAWLSVPGAIAGPQRRCRTTAPSSSPRCVTFFPRLTARARTL
jgi:hypothetical protein